MAKTDIKVVISAQNKYTSQLKRAAASFKSTGQAIGRGIKIGAAIGAAALVSVIALMWKATAAAGVQEDAEIRLTAALGHRSQALLDQASALQQVTKFGDEQIIMAQSLIASFVKDEDQIKAATKATLDLAAAKGMDLKAAADLISKTLGSSTNAMARYGIQVEGAVGSTERLESLTTNIADVFGGQAQAQANIFTGRMTQMKNAAGDVVEQIGMLITKNKFFNDIVEKATKLFAGWATQIAANRIFLMGLAKDGLGFIVTGLGSAIELIRFFHNGWLGLKLVANAATVVIADSLRIVYESLRLILLPLDLIFKGAVKLGAIDVNPFDGMREGLEDFQNSSREGTKEVLDDIAKTNAAYDKVKITINAAGEAIKNMKASALATPEIPGIKILDAIVIDPQTEAIKIRMQFRDAEIEQMTNFTDIMAFHAERGVAISGEMAASIMADNQRIAWSATARSNITARANKAMETQILSLIETGKFSVGEMARIMAQQVKIELAGIAAKAAVQALYFTGLGIAASTPWGAATLGPPNMFFAAATKMALISGASIAAAAGVNALVGGSAEASRAAPGTPGGEPVQTQSIIGDAANREQLATQEITIQIIIPDGTPVVSPETLESLAEPIVDMLSRAGKERNLRISTEALEGVAA